LRKNLPKNRFLRKINTFLKANNWKMIKYIDLGTTSHIFIIEKKRNKKILKVLRRDFMQSNSVKLEYNILKYLNTNKMSKYVPAIEDWIEEINGFFMEYLEYPSQPENINRIYNLADALQTLHSVTIPNIEGIQDYRLSVGIALINEFKKPFKLIVNNHEWKNLTANDVPKLEIIRSKFKYYNNLLEHIEPFLKNMANSLAHGDLAGDNIMIKMDGDLALIDWGEAAISSGLFDLAYLMTYSQWNNDIRERFLKRYCNNNSLEMNEKLPLINKLSELYRYRSCIRSLCRLRDYKENGLDMIGLKFFENQLKTI